MGRNRNEDVQQDPDLKKACKFFKTGARNVSKFKAVDPFNPQNEVEGYLNKDDSVMGGSIAISHVNGKKLKKLQFIFGTPKLAYPYQDYEKYDFIKFKNVHSYVIINKWNGTNVLFYKYKDDAGNVFVTAKSKGMPFMVNSKYGLFLNLTVEALGYKMVKKEKPVAAESSSSAASSNENGTTTTTASTTTDSKEANSGSEEANKAEDANEEANGAEGGGEEGERKVVDTLDEYEIPKDMDLVKNPPNPYIAQLAKDANIQSMSFELCGKKEPHLVAYDFDLKLHPLFFTKDDNFGNIEPVVTGNADLEYGPKKFESQEQLVTLCKEFQQKDLEANKAFREKNGLKHKYEYDHFAIEGRVLYCLDSRGNVLNRVMYKLKPSDIEEVHWGTFDENMMSRVDEALKKINERGRDMTWETIQQELDMGEKEWGKFGKHVQYYVGFVKKPENLKTKPKDSRLVLVLCGLPGSGKTHFTNKLIPGKEQNSMDRQAWDVLTHDVGNLGTLKAMTARFSSGLRNPKRTTVIDRVNHTVLERSEWVQLAQKSGVSKDCVLCVYFATPAEVCQQRMKESAYREQHPKKQTTLVRLDNNTYQYFAGSFVAPTAEEGFGKVFTVSNEEDLGNVVKEIQEVQAKLK